VPLIDAPPRGRRASTAATPGQALIAELVGPAGAGKTAMLHAIARLEPGIRAGVHIDRWRDLPTVIRYAIALVPIGLELLRDHPRSFRSAMGQLLRLRTLPLVLDREASAGRHVIMLDEGPLFALGRLSAFQAANRGTTLLAREWRRQLEQWAGRLDLVIWLDAPDSVLVQRIRSRSKSHRVKETGDAAVFEFLDRYRRAYEEIRARVTASGRTRMIDVNTAELSAEQAVGVVLTTLAPSRGR
jgi:hypothetical protein